jgi:hypothetical protein
LVAKILKDQGRMQDITSGRLVAKILKDQERMQDITSGRLVAKILKDQERMRQTFLAPTLDLVRSYQSSLIATAAGAASAATPTSESGTSPEGREREAWLSAIRDWSPTRGEARLLIEVLTFLAAATWFIYSLAGREAPKPLQSAVEALLAATVLLMRLAFPGDD